MRRCVLAGVVVLCTASASFAYRPFDGTDAAVAERGVLEVELGPAGLLRLGPDRFLVAPALIANLGFADRWELVLEGRQHLLLGSAPPDEPRSRLVDTAVSVKSVLREGALQDRRGPSVAAEVGVLLPTVNDEPGIGAQAAGIVSQRFGPLTAHFTLQRRWRAPSGSISSAASSSKALGAGRSGRSSKSFRSWRARSERRSAPSQG